MKELQLKAFKDIQLKAFKDNGNDFKLYKLVFYDENSPMH